jgi:hypothetical protein
MSQLPLSYQIRWILVLDKVKTNLKHIEILSLAGAIGLFVAIMWADGATQNKNIGDQYFVSVLIRRQSHPGTNLNSF